MSKTEPRVGVSSALPTRAVCVARPVPEESMARKINVLSVDDSRTVLAQLARILEHVDGLEIVESVCAAAANRPPMLDGAYGEWA